MTTPDPFDPTLARRRALALRCPVCGRGRPFRGWFAMASHCDTCGFRFEREPGYFLGSIYLNYGLTAAMALGWILVHLIWIPASAWRVYATPATFTVLFPLWFHRRARALWMAFDLRFDPPTAQDFEPLSRRESPSE